MVWSGRLEMNYVCKSLTWWQTGVLVVELKLEQLSPETAGYLLPVTTGRQPECLTVPIPWDVRFWTEQLVEDAFGLFMQKLTPLLTQLDMGLVQKEQISTALISLALSVRNSLSTQALPVYFITQTTE